MRLQLWKHSDQAILAMPKTCTKLALALHMPEHNLMRPVPAWTRQLVSTCSFWKDEKTSMKALSLSLSLWKKIPNILNILKSTPVRSNLSAKNDEKWWQMIRGLPKFAGALPQECAKAETVQTQDLFKKTTTVIRQHWLQGRRSQSASETCKLAGHTPWQLGNLWMCIVRLAASFLQAIYLQRLTSETSNIKEIGNDQVMHCLPITIHHNPSQS